MLICPESFLSQILTHVEGDFLDQFLGSKRSTYTQVNTVLSQAQTPIYLSPNEA